MVIPDFKLERWAKDGGLIPFDPECINPASVDLRWSGKYRVANPDGWSSVFLLRNNDILRIPQGHLFLLDTVEFVKVPVEWSGIIALKSSIGRMGLEHLHAGFFDPGFHGTATLEITNMAPWDVELRPLQRIIQIVFTQLQRPPRKDYSQTGHYQGQVDPTIYEQKDPWE